MPTYEYLCQTCSHRFETWQKMTDEPLTICPECGASIRRVLFPAGVVFKGSGFYKTDYNGKNAAASPTADTKKSEGSSESKPAETATSTASESSSTAASTPSSSSASAPASTTTSK
ncbi:FmdB family zinc ribbon protein [Tengunoibacter tsumagoiensis]|uniref:FmdB family zinc ribbon protein n=1 Tax=Tengunoibacter tsumagoiensis TaxID=2014871 RepID=UPI000F823908|nr:FmdB family zinc ribbon protein [Tengunoibacter tsumagoiensis]